MDSDSLVGVILSGISGALCGIFAVQRGASTPTSSTSAAVVCECRCPPAIGSIEVGLWLAIPAFVIFIAGVLAGSLCCRSSRQSLRTRPGVIGGQLAIRA